MGKTIYGRAMIVAKADLPFIRGITIAHGSAVITADTTDDTYLSRSRIVRTGSATIVADTTDNNVLCRVYDPGTHVYIDAALVRPDEVLCYNLPLNQSQILELIQEQLANLEIGGPGDITYDDLPDPGSFISNMTDYL